jgi:hypothetical protein
MRKRLLCLSDRHDAFLRGESERLEMSVSGVIRGIIELYIESKEAKTKSIKPGGKRYDYVIGSEVEVKYVDK